MRFRSKITLIFVIATNKSISFRSKMGLSSPYVKQHLHILAKSLNFILLFMFVLKYYKQSQYGGYNTYNCKTVKLAICDIDV